MPSTIKARDLMRDRARAVSADATVQQAAMQMRLSNLTSLVVTQGSNFIGIVTADNIVTEAVARGYDPRETTVRQIMDTEQVACRASDSPTEVARSMQEHEVRSMMVIDSSRQPVGVITLDDLASAGRLKLAGEVLAATYSSH